MTVKIYHLHLLKTAGTSLNEWLDDSVSFELARPPSWHFRQIDWLKQNGIGRARSCKSVTYANWDLFDVIHDHQNILPMRPPNSLVVTVLRDPVERAISLFHDHASLVEADFAHRLLIAVRFHRDCLVMPFSQLSEKWSKHAIFGYRYYDHMCRILLCRDFTYRQFLRMTPEERFVRASAKIEAEIDAVGVAEQMGKTAHYFSQVLGLYPRTSLPRFNARRPEMSEFSREDRRFLESINVGDRLLYDHFRRKFDELRVDYSVEAFERDKLRDAMRRVKVARSGRQTIYKMSAALIGDGFWGRDSRGTPDCCRWTGPGDDSVLYVPAFDEAVVEIAVDVRGWLSPAARANFRVKVWGEAVEPSFSPGENLADVVRFRGAPRDGVVKLEFHAPARTDEECGHPNSDGRRKGFLINRIVVAPA